MISKKFTKIGAGNQSTIALGQCRRSLAQQTTAQGHPKP